MGFKLGLYIRDARTRKNFTSNDLSKLTGISFSYINYIENGKREPSISKLIRISQALECEFKELFHIYQIDQVSKLTDDYKDYDVKSCIKAMESLAPESDSIKRLKKLDNYSNVELQCIIKMCTELDEGQLKKLRKSMEVWFEDRERVNE